MRRSQVIWTHSSEKDQSPRASNRGRYYEPPIHDPQLWVIRVIFRKVGLNIQHTVRYTELSPTRFKDFWRSARESPARDAPVLSRLGVAVVGDYDGSVSFTDF
jgi:hypothetical protein